MEYEQKSAKGFDDGYIIPVAPYWFRHDDGRKNRNRDSDQCLDEAAGDIRAGTIIEGIFAYAYHPQIVMEGKYCICLPATKRNDFHKVTASLGVWGSRGYARLDVYGLSLTAEPGSGTMRVRRK
jgi:hypothetical protein